MILLDTHALIWLTSNPEKLSQKARTAIEKAQSEGEELAIVDMSLLEVALLAARRRIAIGMDLNLLIQSFESQFVVKPITARACVKSLELPASYPKDPADRIIGATALVEGIPLVTADAQIRRSKAVKTIW